jgi:hypothetical protein
MPSRSDRVGGALALAYYAEPRSTIDIDLNLFVPAGRFSDVVQPLVRLGAQAAEPAVADLVAGDGQVRVIWDATPLDLVFSYASFHDAAGRARRQVPFADGSIPVLAAGRRTVGKVVHDRPKDWVDIEAMLADGTTVDTAEVLRWVGRVAGDDDPSCDRVAGLLPGR